VGEIAEWHYKLRHARLSVYPSVCMEQFGSLWRDFHETWYLRNFRKSVGQIQVSLKYDKNDRYLNDVMLKSRSALLIKGNVQTKIVEKLKTRVFYSMTLSRKSCSLWDIVEKSGRDRVAIDNNLERRAHVLCWVTNTTDMRSVFLLIAFGCNNCYANALPCYAYDYIASLVLV